MIRMFVIGFIGLSIVYICVSLYSRAVRKAKLAVWYEDSDKSVDKETYIRQGLAKYDVSLRPKLILLVYIVPLTVIVAAVYMQNFW